jgi:Ca2+:H+ antiporter
VALVAVVLLAKLFAVVISAGVSAIGAPAGVTGVIIALIVLTPEAIAAVTAASRDNLQKSLNLALGSSLATIGLTIPAIAAANIILQKPLILGLEPRDLALVMMTLAASILTFGTGRTNVLFGFLHLVIFGTFLFFAFVP